MKPGLTLAVIAKNEEAKLGRCLGSVKAVADEILVVDTGSTDSTVELAKSLGAEVRHFEWCDDTAAAKNVALDYVSSEWTLMLDSDEWLFPESGPMIRRFIEEDAYDGAHLTRVDDKGALGFSEMEMPRLWRTSLAPRFRGIIHERFPDEVFKQSRWLHSGIRFGHDGLREVGPEKLRRNLRLLEKQLDMTPDDTYYEICRADTLTRLGDPAGEGAIDALVVKALKMEESNDVLVSWLFANALERTPAPQLFSPRTERIIKRCWSWYPYAPLPMWAVAMTEIRRGDKMRAHKTLKHLEQMALTGGYSRTGAFDPGILGTALWKTLGQVAQEVGDSVTADACRRRLLATG